MQIINRQLDQNVGPRFLSVSNEDLLNLLGSRFGQDNLKVARPKGPGDRLLATIDVPDMQFDAPELGGLFTPRLWVRNSNMGDQALTVGVGLFRFLCLNGLYYGFGAFGAKVRHTDGPTAHTVLDGLPEALDAGFKSLAEGSVIDTAYEALETTVLDPISVVGSLPQISDTVKEKVIGHIVRVDHREEDKPHTAWGLYNLVNEVVRRRSRSLYRAGINDIGLLENIQTLAQSQQSLVL